ncbi:hypothetical protein ACWKSP_15725 [Micromonosporaceae bacterium Da 78-11]
MTSPRIPKRRTPKPGRARQRAIRSQASEAGVPYLAAARQLAAADLQPGEAFAAFGRTVYPAGPDSFRRATVERRRRRSFEERLADTRRAAVLPQGRAEHLAERFPPTRGLPGTGVGPMYHGEHRRELLTMLYLVVAAESPGLIPAVGDLAWIAEMGEETALDMACAALDRDARAIADRRPAALWPSVERALLLAERNGDWQIRQGAARLAAMYRAITAPRESPAGEPYAEELSLDGVRQILDAVLIVADDGHAPGTRVRVLSPAHRDRTGTIVGAMWSSAGPPVGYVVRPDDAGAAINADPGDLVILADQESLTR